MTPLAHQLAKQLTLPVRKRDPYWRENGDMLRRALSDTHFFECTQLIPAIHDLGERYGDQPKDRRELIFASLSKFLPAPKTWIEYVPGRDEGVANPLRFGVLLEESPDGELADATLFREAGGKLYGFCHIGVISLVSIDQWITPGRLDPHMLRFIRGLANHVPGLNPASFCREVLSTCVLLIAFINTPRIIGRRQHMPHRGLERELTRSLGVGMFPLRAWTEIKLEVAKPIEIDDGEPHEAHLTGRRALHFVRKHIRIRLGRLEYVSAHWRGDPALGIKQSRYLVTA